MLQFHHSAHLKEGSIHLKAADHQCLGWNVCDRMAVPAPHHEVPRRCHDLREHSTPCNNVRFAFRPSLLLKLNDSP